MVVRRRLRGGLVMVVVVVVVRHGMRVMGRDGEFGAVQ